MCFLKRLYQSEFFAGVTSSMEDADNFKRLRGALINHHIVTANRPEKDRFIGQVGTLVPRRGFFANNSHAW